MKLKDKVAIISGGGSGMGKETALLFAKEGAIVVITDRNEKAAETVAEKIKQEGGFSLSAKVDITIKNDIHALVDKVICEYKKIDILVNSAGMNVVESFIESNQRYWDTMINVNLKGTIQYTWHVLPYMVERHYGKIIHIASGAGIGGAEKQVVYSAAKGGVVAFTRALAREMAPYHINVNVICPGPSDTPMMDPLRTLDPTYMEKLVNSIPWKRLIKPEEIAAAALYFASDDSEIITGHALMVDGGSSMI
jgi:2-hydroxycyclohexanecarboxyl-CoA dehydrogenase